MQAAGTRRRLTVPQDQPAPGALCLRTRHLLLDDGRHQRAHDIVTAAETQTPQPIRQLAQPAARQVQGARLVLGTKQARQRRDGSLCTGTPGHRPPAISGSRERHGGRAFGRAPRAPDRAPYEADGRIPRAVPQWPQRQHGVHLEAQLDDGVDRRRGLGLAHLGPTQRRRRGSAPATRAPAPSG